MSYAFSLILGKIVHYYSLKHQIKLECRVIGLKVLLFIKIIGLFIVLEDYCRRIKEQLGNHVTIDFQDTPPMKDFFDT